jgi:arsenate reductase
MPDRKLVVLFLCTGNSCRSQLGEALLRRLAGDRFEVHSAGLDPKPIHPLTREVLAEIGIDIDAAGQRSKTADEFLGRLMIDYLIIVCDGAARRCPTSWPASPRLKKLAWPFEDPAAFEGDEETTLAKFREVRDRIDRKLREWVAELDAEPAATT